MNILLQNEYFLPYIPLIGHAEFRRGGRCRRAQVGNIVQNRSVDLMPYRRDHRPAAGGCGAGDTLGVEHPQILFAAAAAGDQDQVGPRVAVQPADAVHDTLFSLDALHADGGQQQFHHRPAAANDVLHVLPRCAGLARDNADTPRYGGQRALALGCKQALGLQLFVQRVKRHLRGTRAEGLHIVSVELERAVPLIDRGASVDEHQHTVLRFEVQKLCLGAEHDSLDGGVLILEREIQMPALVMPRKAGNFPADDQIVQRVALLQNALCQPVQAGYIDVVGHAPHSLAARIEMPMALSLANFPGTKCAFGTRFVT